MNRIIELINNLENETSEDKEQMKRALKCTEYRLYDDYNYRKKITRNDAIRILGEEMFVSGLERSAFHWTAARTNEDKTILFDSRKLFEEVK